MTLVTRTATFLDTVGVKEWGKWRCHPRSSRMLLQIKILLLAVRLLALYTGEGNDHDNL